MSHAGHMHGHGGAMGGEANTKEAWMSRGHHSVGGPETYQSGVLAYYWPNATYVHCKESGPCSPIVIDAGAYEGKLPAFLYEEFVNEYNKIVIPCGKPVKCGTMTPLGPFGPLAANHSEMLGFDFTANNHGVQWHPVLYPCGDGAYAHAVVTVIACIILLPLAFAARARKASKANTSSSSTASRGSSDDDDESAGPWASLVNKYWIECVHLLAIFLIFLSLATQAATQSALASKPECQNTRAAHGTDHGVMGWVCLILLLAERFVHYSLLYMARKQRVGGANAIFTVLVCLPLFLSKAFGLLPVLFKPVLGFRMSAPSFKLVTLLILTFGYVLTFMWQSCDCYEYSSFLSQEVGHMTYALLWIVLGGLSLAYNHPKVRKKHQLHEGILLLLGGLLSVCVVTFGSGGGIFFSGRSMMNQTAGGAGFQQYMKDLQHTVQAGIWATAGFMNVCIARIGVESGLPVLLATLCHGSMVMLHGHQANELALLGHKLHAYTMITAGIMRFLGRLPEFSFFLSLAATLFISSSKCMASWANAYSFDPISYFLCTVVITAVLWSWLVFTCTDTSRALKAERAEGLGNYYTSDELERRFVSCSKRKGKAKLIDVAHDLALELGNGHATAPEGFHES